MGEISHSNKFATIWVRRLSKLLVISTLLLIFAGALVKSHEVGLSVPDWPTSYGYQMFSFPFTDMKRIKYSEMKTENPVSKQSFVTSFMQSVRQKMYGKRKF